MMKTALALVLAASALVACSKPSNPSNAAVNAEQNRTAEAPTSGDNSFTESQARGHLANAGYTDITDMKQDANGLWRGQATKEGKTGPVAVDYRGTVTPG